MLLALTDSFRCMRADFVSSKPINHIIKAIFHIKFKLFNGKIHRLGLIVVTFGMSFALTVYSMEPSTDHYGTHSSNCLRSNFP